MSCAWLALAANNLRYVVCVGAQLEDALIGQRIRAETTLLPPASVDGLARLAGRLISCC